MQSTIWVIAAVAVVALVLGVGVVTRRHRRSYVPAIPVTISVAEPVEDILESPRHAAQARATAARAAEAQVGGTVAGHAAAAHDVRPPGLTSAPAHGKESP